MLLRIGRTVLWLAAAAFAVVGALYLVGGIIGSGDTSPALLREIGVAALLIAGVLVLAARALRT